MGLLSESAPGIKNSQKLLQDVAPVLDGHAPFFLDVHDGQVDGFLDGHVIGELDLGLGVFSDSTVEVFDGVRCVDDLLYLEPSNGLWDVP